MCEVEFNTAFKFFINETGFFNNDPTGKDVVSLVGGITILSRSAIMPKGICPVSCRWTNKGNWASLEKRGKSHFVISRCCHLLKRSIIHQINNEKQKQNSLIDLFSQVKREYLSDLSNRAFIEAQSKSTQIRRPVTLEQIDSMIMGSSITTKEQLFLNIQMFLANILFLHVGSSEHIQSVYLQVKEKFKAECV